MDVCFSSWILNCVYENPSKWIFSGTCISYNQPFHAPEPKLGKRDSPMIDLPDAVLAFSPKGVSHYYAAGPLLGYEIHHFHPNSPTLPLFLSFPSNFEIG